MAKFVLTIEDTKAGQVSVTVDKSEAPISILGRATKAGALAVQLQQLAEVESVLSRVPVCALMPAAHTLH